MAQASTSLNANGFLHSGQDWTDSVRMVKDLMVEGTESWNSNLVEQIISLYEASLIQQILSLHLNQDMQVWRHPKEGEYTRLWHIKYIPGCKDLSWRACQGILPVCLRLKDRGVIEDTICPMSLCVVRKKSPLFMPCSRAALSCRSGLLPSFVH
ncbi:hypothetical protein RIF29_40874 [Crotalaria pallida]|uniref:Uncharacterized protein n=1 Tax=Crotalaria pallida TaxID=3830 RepID=A0AAN9HS33_CROPI